jgi:FtsH-binding integral membrane protein
MEFYDNNIYSVDNSRSIGAYSTLMRKVYVWMSLALCITGLTAFYVASNATLMTAIASNKILFFGLIIGEIALVIGLTAAINRISFFNATLLFILYSVLNGVTMSFIFLAYTMSSIASTFFITAGTFCAMAFVGYATKKDLTRFGGFFLMAIIGLVIATVVNMFVASTMLDWIISYVGVFVFIGLTAYDSQKIKNMLMAYGTDVNEGTQKLALMGSLTLYLDFINLFIYLLRIFGRRN